ncbi:MAG: conjugal transfer protein TraG N-terminal domain-containing protein [Chlorobium sp.]|nr:conjugal transfer protein TraG N-terminal domain-containing protein [Chlorobium sp.]
MKKPVVTFPAISFLVFLVAALFQATPACAIDMEYYTYGGFGPITQAFTRLALIFSDAGYIGLFTVVTVLGFLAGGISGLIQVSNGGKAVPLIWAVPVIFGVVLYLGLFVPKGNITVYDPTLNRFQTIGGIPDAVVFTAGVLNKVERGLVDIIDTAAGPGHEYGKGAGGIGFKTLEAVKGSYISDNHLRTSTIKYMKDCVTFELMRPNTTLSLDTLRNDTDDFIGLLGLAVNPAVYTVYYDSANPSGVTKTCTEAWNLIRPAYQNPTNYNDAIRKVCGKATFNPDNVAEFNQCKQLVANTTDAVINNPVQPERLIQQRMIAEILYTFYFQDDVETAMLMEADRKITSSGIGIGITMNEWIPVIKAIMTAIAIGMIPFLALFLPTPVVGKALSAMFGFFCFLTIWGITDAVVHTAAMDYAANLFEEVEQSSLGVYAMAAFPSKSLKMLAMFGVIRSSGIMLASVFTMMLVKFGGHALAMMAGNITGQVSSAGSHAGALLTPEGTASAMQQQVKSAGLMEGMAEHRFSNQASAEAFNNVHSPVGNYNSSMNARAALEKSGQIPKGTSDAGYAEMQKNFNQQAGTAGGQASLSLGPDGQATQGKTNAVMSSGSTVAGTTAGVDGAGVQNLSGAWGKASFTTDGHGGNALTSANINGMSPMALARQNANILTEKASHSFGTNQGWDMLRSQLQSDGYTSSEARGYNEKLSNSEASGWDRVINDKSGFTRSLGADQQEQLSVFAKASGGITVLGTGAQAGGEFRATVTGKDGRTLSFAVDESTAKSIKEAETDIREKAFTETFGSGQGLQYATGLANKVGATEAASYMKDASNMSRTTETTGADATTAFVRWYANDRFGSSSHENIDKAGEALNHMATGGAAGMAQLQDHQQRFLKSGNYSWGDGKTQAGAEINATRVEIGGGTGSVQGQVMPAVNAASERTENIGPGDFGGHPADQHNPLTSSRMEGQKTFDEAEDMRDKNDHDSSTVSRPLDTALFDRNKVDPLAVIRNDPTVKAFGDTVSNADQISRERDAARKAAGKPPLEGD